MDFDVRESHTGIADTYRYQIAVRKGDGKSAIYHLDFKKIGQNMHHWFAPVYMDTAILNNAFSLEFYDVKALSDVNRYRRSAFDTYTALQCNALYPSPTRTLIRCWHRGYSSQVCLSVSCQDHLKCTVKASIS